MKGGDMLPTMSPSMDAQHDDDGDRRDGATVMDGDAAMDMKNTTIN